MFILCLARASERASESASSSSLGENSTHSG